MARRFRKRAAPDEVPSQCLELDDNDYPKHLWAFVFTGKPFRKHGPEDYQLAHLFDHKEHGNRWRSELDLAPGMDRVPDFLEFRRERMGELIDKRYAALRTDGAR